MNSTRRWLPLAVALLSAFLVNATPAPVPPYIPAAVFCYQPASTHGPVINGLCPNLPGNIGADPALTKPRLGYKGIADGYPATFGDDVESPFDNYSWQTFVALNWKQGQKNSPASAGLNGGGPRVWEGYKRISEVFGNSPIQANCPAGPGEEVFSIAAKRDGSPATRNEEYIQAATGKPAIDVNGNWTIYERRVNDIEIAYLKAPGGNTQWDLTTLPGQAHFVAASQSVNFPAIGALPNGAMEIKAAWRILDPKNHAANARHFYVVRAVLAVAPALVDRGTKAIVAPICAHVDMGLVAMHIIQKNPLTKPPLKPEWFWSTFEHVDNAPLAAVPCDITNPATCGNPNQLACPVKLLTEPAPDYSYFNAKYPGMLTNQPPVKPKTAKAYLWNPTPPYAKAYLTKTAANATTWVGTQVSRCWQIYRLTQQLNSQWQQQLRAVNSVFANYMLIGTQWGTSIEGGTPSPGPEDAAPNYLSNSVVETYLQTYYSPKNGFNTGSCVSCHNVATLTANANVPSDFSFLPSEVNPLLSRRDFLAPIPK
ncbi:MAG: hypothetical protein WDM86_13550 [Rhizomicrobium sp.]